MSRRTGLVRGAWLREGDVISGSESSEDGDGEDLVVKAVRRRVIDGQDVTLATLSDGKEYPYPAEVLVRIVEPEVEWIPDVGS